MSVASNMLLLQVATSQAYRSAPRSVYSGEALSLGGGQSPMPDGDNDILVTLFCLTAALCTLGILAYAVFK